MIRNRIHPNDDEMMLGWELNKVCSTDPNGGDIPNVTLSKTEDRYVVILSDVHIGAADFNQELFERYMDIIDELNAYVILGGDILEFAVPTHIPEAMWEQTLSTDQQFKYTRKLFDRFRDRIIFSCSGNHEWRSYKKIGIDISEHLARDLGCFYTPNGGYIGLNVGKEHYNFAVFHGSSGAQTNIWTELERRWAVFHDADLVAAGHIHHLAHKALPKVRIVDGNYTRDYVHFVRTGSFITEPLYGQMAGYSPTLDGAPIIRLSATKHQIEVNAGGEISFGS